MQLMQMRNRTNTLQRNPAKNVPRDVSCVSVKQMLNL